MPGLKRGTHETTIEVASLGAALAARPPRRTWAHPELASHSLLVLTLDRLYLAPLVGDPKPETLAAVQAGTDLDKLFGPLDTILDLAAVRRLKLDLLTNSLLVEYAGGGAAGTRWVTVAFATPEAADACFTKVWRRLGGAFALAPYRRDAWSLARGPLALLFAALLATALLVAALSMFEDGAPDRGGAPVSNPGRKAGPPPSRLEALLAWLDWKAVCAVGGAAAAFSQVWLYRRLTTPPVSLELVKS
jgi:hypothetical protein